MSFLRYPKYKDTGVEWLGSVPAHWIVTPIKRFGWLKGGSGFPHESQGVEGEELDFHKVNALGTADLDDMLLPSENTISFDTAKKLGAYVFPKGTIIFAKVGAALLLGRIRELASPACIDNNMMGLVVTDPATSVRYLRYAMSLIRFDLISNPGAVPSLNERQIGDFAIVCPPGPEQVAIANFLDAETRKIDGLVAEQEKLIALLKEKHQAVISHAVTKGLDPNVPMKDSGIEWLGEVPSNWHLTPVKHLIRIIEQGWSPQCESFPVETDSEWGVLKVGCVNGGNFNAGENKRLPDDQEPLPELGLAMGDLLISRANTRELVGSAAVVDRDYPKLLLCDKLYRLRLFNERLLPDFFSYYLGSDRVRGQIELAATGASSSMLNIGQSTILELLIAIPELAEQSRIVQHIGLELGKIETLMAAAKQVIGLLVEHRSALISAAVTGKIDVRQLASAEAA